MRETVRFYFDLAGITFAGVGVAIVGLAALVAVIAAGVLYFTAAGV
jgi:hypothetical protein